MRNLLFWSLIITCSSVSFSQTQKIATANQQWIQYYSQLNITNKWQVGFDAGVRWKDECAKLSQIIGRGNATFQIGKNFKLGAGFVQSGLYDNSTLLSSEFRPFQEISFAHKKEKFEFNNRIRIEQRLIKSFAAENNISDNFIMRSRFNFTFLHFLINPIKRNGNIELWWLFGDELFVNIVGSKSFNWFDQNRFFLGPLLKLNANISIQLLYSAQISPTLNSTSYRLTHVTWLSLKHKINFAKEK